MFQGIFRSTSIPVLEQVVNFAQARHQVLAGNLANIATPGYESRDLSVNDFQSRLKDAIDTRDRVNAMPAAPNMPAMPPSPGMSSGMSPGLAPLEEGPDLMAEASKNPMNILYHDQSRDAIELQVIEMAKNQSQHNMAVAIMNSQFRQLQSAISERV